MPAGSFHTAVLKARLRLHLTQAEVADRIDCHQSAISSFEKGKRGVLSNEKIEQFAELVGVKLPAARDEAEGDAVPEEGGKVLAFCPCEDCPVGMPVAIKAKIVVRPVMMYVEAGLDPSFCKECGAQLESGCRKCLTEVKPGATHCTGCGLALVPVADLPPGADLEEEVQKRLARRKEYLTDAPPIETYARPELRNAGRRQRA